MKRRRGLIESPLDWFLTANPVPSSGDSRHRGTRRDAAEDTQAGDRCRHREQNPLDFSRFSGWFSGVEYRLMRLGHYSIAGLEDVCVVERKDLPDLCARLRSSDSCS